MWTKRVAHYGLVSTLIVTGIVAVYPSAAHRPARSADAAPPMTDAAYRDGLFQGTLAAQRCSENHPSIGRWAGDEQRVHFVLGYERGYRDGAGAAACGPRPP